MKIGTYAVEQDYSHYVAYASKTILAVVGTATKGPVGVPTVCTSAQDLTNKFGPLNPECYALYAGQHFLSQASKLYFVRAAHDQATPKGAEESEDDYNDRVASEAIAKESTATIPGVSTSTTAVADAIVVQALEKGTYADGYYLTVINPDKTSAEKNIDTFDLILYSTSDVVLEHIKNVKLEDLTTEYKTGYIKIYSISTSATKITTGTYYFSGGDNGTEEITDDDYIAAAEALKADSIDMNLFATPGVTSVDVITSMLALAEERGDCMYLVDPPKGLTREGVAQWHNGEGSWDHEAFDSSYGALYYDWLTIYDNVNKVRVDVPPSVVVGATYAYSDRTTDPWYAPAGLNRGLVRGVLDSVTKLSKRDIEYLYSDPNHVNCIYDDPQVGLVLWGQKTLSRETTSLNRVNVRRLLNYLKRVITAACNYLTFDANDRITWNSFEMKVLPVLKDVQNKRGLYRFSVSKGESVVTTSDIDNHRMPCTIMIQPTKSAEEIPIYFSITSTGADFGAMIETN